MLLLYSMSEILYHCNILRNWVLTSSCRSGVCRSAVCDRIPSDFLQYVVKEAKTYVSKQIAKTAEFPADCIVELGSTTRMFSKNCPLCYLSQQVQRLYSPNIFFCLNRLYLPCLAMNGTRNIHHSVSARSGTSAVPELPQIFRWQSIGPSPKKNTVVGVFGRQGCGRFWGVKSTIFGPRFSSTGNGKYTRRNLDIFLREV